MKKELFCAFMLSVVVLLCAGQEPADLQGVKSLSDGFYYKTAQGWQKLEPLSSSGSGMKHVAKILVPGLTPQIVWRYPSAEAPAQIADKKPTFCIKQSLSQADTPGRSGRDVLIVRLDKKKDYRELQTTKGGNVLTFKAGVSKERAPEITTKTVADGIFLVTPNQELQPGEYMLTFNALGHNGYDFGIKP